MDEEYTKLVGFPLFWSCETVRSRQSDIVGPNLTSAEVATLEEHVECCSGCGDLVRSWLNRGPTVRPTPLHTGWALGMIDDLVWAPPQALEHIGIELPGLTERDRVAIRRDFAATIRNLRPAVRTEQATYLGRRLRRGGVRALPPVTTVVAQRFPTDKQAEDSPITLHIEEPFRLTKTGRLCGTVRVQESKHVGCWLALRFPLEGQKTGLVFFALLRPDAKGQCLARFNEDAPVKASIELDVAQLAFYVMTSGVTW
jgi:hypothetical protein